MVVAGLMLVALVIGIELRQRKQSSPEIPAPSPSDPLAVTPVATTPAPTPAAAPAEEGLPPVVPISLTNVLIDAENGSWLRDKDYQLAPHRPHEFGGVEFLMDGMIQLQGRLSKEWRNRKYRTTVVLPLAQTNIVDGNFEVTERGHNIGSLYLLGGTRYGTDQKVSAEVVWDYTDGTSEHTPVEHLNHIRDWTRNPYDQPPHLPYPFTKVVWAIPRSSQPGQFLRLYRVAFANPQPGKDIRRLEFVSTMQDPTLFIVGVTLDPLAPGERPDNTPDLEPTDARPPNKIQISVQNSGGVPLPQSLLQVQFQQQNGQNMSLSTISVSTDNNGTADVAYPPESLARLDISASHDDYGSRKMAWDLAGGDNVPANYTLKLGDSFSIGGVIVDPDGQPVSGATISFFRFWSGGDGSPDKKGEQADFQSKTTSTDALGKWQAKNLPLALLDHIMFDVKHPDFLGTNINVAADDTVETQLRAGTHKLILHRGLVVRGRVTDESDNPVSGATVWSGKHYYRERQQTKSDAQGQFTFHNISEGDVLFSVIAKGRRPDNKTINVHAGMDEIVFRLPAGNVIRAHVQDETGDSLAGARVSLAGGPGDAAYDAYEFSANTDGDGNFAWEGAPDEAMPFFVYHEGYEAKRDVKLAPNQDNVVTLHPNRKLQGLVLDSTTEQPVVKFTVRAGHRESETASDVYGVIRDHDFNAPDGKFSLDLDEEADNAVAVSGDGYTKTVQSFPEAQNGNVQVVVHLKPCVSLSGVVVSPDGTPLPGVSVAIAPNSGSGGVSLQGSRLHSWSLDTKVSTTDVAGRFTVNSPSDTGGMVVAAGDPGFASASVDQVRANPTLVLQLWGRIEGTLKIGGQPGAGKDLMLNLNLPGLATDWNSYKRTTDDQGAFTFEKVPPGQVSIVRLIQTTPNSWQHSNPKSVFVEAGKTTPVTLGDTGAVLKGHVRFEMPPAEGQSLNVSGNLSSSMPPTPSFNSSAEAQAFFNSAEWQAVVAEHPNFAVVAGADGTFTVDSVPPGTYSLNLSARKASSQLWKEKPLAEGRATITVPDDANPLSPFDVGEIVLKSVPTQ